MVRKLVLVSIILVAAGLVLLVMSNPLLRAVTGSTTFTPRQFTGNFTSGSFSGNFTGANFARRASGLSTSVIESLSGVGLVGAGLILEVFSIFLPVTQSKPKTE